MPEVLLAYNRVVLHGDLELSWNDYLALAGSAATIAKETMMFGPYTHLRSYLWQHNLPLTPRSFDVIDLLEVLRSSQCLLPHDYVFGMLALFGNEAPFVADYHSGSLELLLNTFLFAIKHNAECSREWFISSGYAILQVSNLLARKLRQMPLFRTQGAEIISIPDVSRPISFRLLTAVWRVVTPCTLGG